jgi:hypothetical protein
MQSNFVAHVRAQVATYGDARSYTYIRDNGGELVNRNPPEPAGAVTNQRRRPWETP